MKYYKIIAVVIFCALVPAAFWYNKSYDKYGTAFEAKQPIFIQLVTSNTPGSFNNALKHTAAEYAKSNTNVRIFVLPLTAQQLNGHEYDISIIREQDTYHAFISRTQTEIKTKHCKQFIEKANTMYEYKLVVG